MDRFKFTADAPAVSMQMAGDLEVGGTWSDPHVPTTVAPAAQRPEESRITGRTGSGREWELYRPDPSSPAYLTLTLDLEGRDWLTRVMRWATSEAAIKSIVLLSRDQGVRPLLGRRTITTLVRSILGADRRYEDDGTLMVPGVMVSVSGNQVTIAVPDHVSLDIQRAAVMAAWAAGYDVVLTRVQA